ncbi:uncharacterized protein LOC142629242 [Castanea sativa]|uniref:uncharacterized protein LOC142629242 n=1 Tax=Castanea sativa TaxID=21020 RepID=UPI003F654113
MEVLGALISKKCNSNLWDPVKVTQGGLAFSHLFFADDLVLFAKANRKNCMAVKHVLDCFCSLSSQKVSQDKFRVYFSPNVTEEYRDELCEILGFRSTPSLWKYLGFPIKIGATPQDFGFIIDHVQSRLSGWKANLLSFAGRLVLTQAVTSTIPNYLALEIKATPISFFASNSDRISWSSFPNGIFDLKDAYKLASSQEGDFSSGMIDGEWVWKVATIPKIQCFIWNNFLFRNVGLSRHMRDEVISRATEFAHLGISAKFAGSLTKIQREWVKGYARAVGCITSVATELWALRDGIKLCIALKIPVVIYELDAQLVVNLLKNSNSHPNGIGALISDYKEGLQKIPMVQVQHCYREANKCADSLARRGALLPQDFVIYLDPPTEVLFLLNLDVAGMYSDRFVSVV